MAVLLTKYRTIVDFRTENECHQTTPLRDNFKSFLSGAFRKKFFVGRYCKYKEWVSYFSAFIGNELRGSRDLSRVSPKFIFPWTQKKRDSFLNYRIHIHNNCHSVCIISSLYWQYLFFIYLSYRYCVLMNILHVLIYTNMSSLWCDITQWKRCCHIWNHLNVTSNHLKNEKGWTFNLQIWLQEVIVL